MNRVLVLCAARSCCSRQKEYFKKQAEKKNAAGRTFGLRTNCPIAWACPQFIPRKRRREEAENGVVLHGGLYGPPYELLVGQNVRHGFFGQGNLNYTLGVVFLVKP